MSQTILVVDDSQSVRQEVRAALVGAGYEVVEAVDGMDGARKIAQIPDLSMVICDVNMPNMTGLEMVSLVKSDPKNSALPIVMLTTEGRMTLIMEARTAGAKGWLVKPFKADQLVATVAKLAGSH